MASPDDRQRTERLIYEYRRRLHLLERRAARQGDDVDPQVEIEAEDLRLNIATLQALIGPEPAPEVLSAVKRHVESDWAMLFAQFVKFGQRLTRVEERVETIAAAQTAAQIERLATYDDVQAIKRQQAETERKRRRWQPFYVAAWAIIVIAVLLALIFGRIYL